MTENQACVWAARLGVRAARDAWTNLEMLGEYENQLEVCGMDTSRYFTAYTCFIFLTYLSVTSNSSEV